MKNFRRFLWLWILCLLLCALLPLWHRLSPDKGPSSLGFFDRHWFAVKQNFQRQIFDKSYLPSDTIKLLQIEENHVLDFWLDANKKSELFDALSKYPGPIITTLNPARMLEDPILAKILQLPNVIRGFTLTNALGGELKVEETAARWIKQDDLPMIGQPIRLSPPNLDYYENQFAGFLDFSIEQSALFISHYPLSLQAIRYQVPSIALAALESKEKFALSYSKDQIQVEGTRVTWPRLLPLHFYTNGFPHFRSVKDLKPSKDILIVNVLTPANAIPNVLGEKSNYAELLATALSNLIEGHFPKRFSWLPVLELVLYLLAIIGIIFFSLAKRLRQALLGILFLFTILLALDLFAGVLLNLETRPVEYLVALSILSLVGISTRAIVDSEERGLVERALSGYVSKTRLRKLLTGKETLDLTGRKMNLSMLMVDIAGFSKLSAPLSPELLFQFVQQFFSIVDPIVFEFGGTIDKKTGDGLLAFFGDQGEATDHAAKMAVKAALAIQRKLKSMRPEDWGTRLSKPVTLRIGINSGSVMIGNAGSSQHFNYTVFGETVNFTQRLEAACPEGRVLIGEHCAELVQTSFSLEPMNIQVKHQSDTSKAFLVKD